LLIVNVNHAPAVNGGEDLWMDEGDAVVLQAVARDPDGDPLKVMWAAGGPGSFDDSCAIGAVFHAPLLDLCEGMDIPLAVTVIDPCGASACDTVIVHVRNVNRAPLVDLGPDFAIDEGQTLRWTPSVTDPDCDALRYCWSATGGTFDATNVSNPLFAVPATFKCAGEPIVVTLTVTDPCGLTASDSVTIQVRNINSAPAVELGMGLCVNEGSTLTLVPQVADADGDVLRYSWTVSAGRLDSTCVATPVFIAPMVDNCAGIDVTVTLTVTDPCGLAATDTAILRVSNVNQPPVVRADP
jgi:large repetitive protein